MCSRYIEGKYLTEAPTDNKNYTLYGEVNRLQLPDNQEPFSCIKYNYTNGDYTNEGIDISHKFIINKPVSYYTSGGVYLGLLEKDDEITIATNIINNTDTTKPWCYKVSKVKRDNNVINNTDAYVSIGLEWGSIRHDRAWIN